MLKSKNSTFKITPEQARVIVLALSAMSQTATYIKPDIKKVAEILYDDLANWQPLIDFVNEEEENV